LQYLLWGSMALGLALLLTIVIHSRVHVRQSFPGSNGAGTKGTWQWPRYPRVAVLVPLTGNSPEMPAALESLFTQTYPNYEILLLTRDAEDSATSLVREVLSRHSRARHIISGPATTCSQKNHNLLAGVRALDGEVEILVFCDSTHKAPPNFLGDLIHPLVTGPAVMSTGFHRIIPGDSRIATIGMLQTVLSIHLLHGIHTIVMPWGGATAILKDAFHKYEVGGALGANVLDDFPLGQRLLRYGIRTKPVATAVLNTDLAGQTGRGWETWLTRQLLYVKYCAPFTWLGSSLPVAVFAGSIIFSVLASLGGILGLVAPSMALTGLVFLLALSALGGWLRSLVPVRIPMGRWLLGFYANLFMISWCYFKTWLTGIIAWRGISYRVTWGGRVKEIIVSPFYKF
jgi:ceramide glucosyltransferase